MSEEGNHFSEISKIKKDLQEKTGKEYSQSVARFFEWLGNKTEYTEERQGYPDVIVWDTRPTHKKIFVIECHVPEEPTRLTPIEKTVQLERAIKRLETEENEPYAGILKKAVMISKTGFTEEVLKIVKISSNHQSEDEHSIGISLIANNDLFKILEFTEEYGRIIPPIIIRRMLMNVGPVTQLLERDLLRLKFFLDIQAIGLYWIIQLTKTNNLSISLEAFLEKIKTTAHIFYRNFRDIINPIQEYALMFLLGFMSSPIVGVIMVKKEEGEISFQDIKLTSYLENSFGDLGKAILKRYKILHELLKKLPSLP